MFLCGFRNFIKNEGNFKKEVDRRGDMMYNEHMNRYSYVLFGRWRVNIAEILGIGL